MPLVLSSKDVRDLELRLGNPITARNLSADSFSFLRHTGYPQWL